MLNRTDHFLPASLLRSQFETLDPPLESIAVSILNSPEEIVAAIKKELFLDQE
jgi:gluconate kinase